MPPTKPSKFTPKEKAEIARLKKSRKDIDAGKKRLAASRKRMK
jgi:hypothetical protein